MDTFSSASLSRIEKTEWPRENKVITRDLSGIVRCPIFTTYAWDQSVHMQLSREFGNYNVQQCVHVLNACKKRTKRVRAKKGMGRVHVHTRFERVKKGNGMSAFMAHNISVQLPTRTHDFKKYS